jgi:hypothetical protein
METLTASKKLTIPMKNTIPMKMKISTKIKILPDVQAEKVKDESEKVKAEAEKVKAQAEIQSEKQHEDEVELALELGNGLGDDDYNELGAEDFTENEDLDDLDEETLAMINADIEAEKLVIKESKKWFLDKPIEEYAWTADGIYKDTNTWTVYLLPNNKKFSQWISEKFNKYRMTGESTNKCSDTSLKQGSKASTNAEMKELFLHQAFITEYMAPPSPYRGILIDHDLGSGKTRTVISTSEQYRAIGVTIIVLLPATLKSTWYNEIKTWGHEDVRRPSNYESLSASEKINVDTRLNAKINRYYKFITYNASTTLDQIQKVTGGQLEHKFVVVEEVHNFISMIVNTSSKKGGPLYDLFMNAIDCKFMFLSATPLQKSPYELGVMFNMLKGYMKYAGKTQITLFPKDQSEFEDFFIDYDTKKIKNPELFKKRIIGLVSYYYGAKADVYPEVKHQPLKKVEFSDYQFSQYAVVRQSEMAKEAKSKMKVAKKKPDEFTASKDEIKSSFRIYSRLFSNFVFPEDIKRPFKPDYYNAVLNLTLPTPSKSIKWTPEQIEELHLLFDDETEYQTFVNQYRKLRSKLNQLKLLYEKMDSLGLDAKDLPYITNIEEQNVYEKQKTQPPYEKALELALKKLEDNKELYLVDQLEDLGPKIESIYNDMTTGLGHEFKAFIYSNFITLEGLNMVARVLDVNGFEPLPHGKINNDLSNIANFVNSDRNRYIIYSGKETPEIRRKILDIFNHPANLYGEICRVFMGTAAAAEGISLKEVCQVFILEPHWHEVRIQQVIGRARRICSHERLPKDKRFVYVYRYHMVLSEEQKSTFPESESSDEAIYRLAKVREEINDQFLRILKDAAVDCRLNYLHNFTTENPIKCFAFDEKETGISFLPDIYADTLDRLFTIQYTAVQIHYTTSKAYPECVYKYTNNKEIAHKEKIRIKANNTEYVATIFYSLNSAKLGIFEPVQALVEIISKDGKKTKQKMASASEFIVIA